MREPAGSTTPEPGVTDAAASDTAPAWPADHVERRAIDTLVPYARNARTHTDAQVEQIAASMKQWGWTNPVLVDEGGGIIAGHGRVLAAHRLGIATVPVMVARGWTDEQKRAYTIADNKLAMNGGWDAALLTPELQDLPDGLLQLVGFSADELRELSIGVAPGEFPEIPEGERSQFCTMTFTLHRSQLARVEMAMKHAHSSPFPDGGPNPNRNGNALTRIVDGYLETCTNSPALATSSSLQ